MHETPRPDELGDERTPVATEAEQRPTAADPRSEPGITGTAARYPLWLIVGAVVIIGLIAVYLAWLVAPGA
jgi:hypothetical protein